MQVYVLAAILSTRGLKSVCNVHAVICKAVCDVICCCVLVIVEEIVMYGVCLLCSVFVVLREVV